MNEPVLLWNTDGQLACTAISSCHPIPPPVPLSRVSLPPQPLCLAALLSALSPVPHCGPSFCFSLLLRVFLPEPFSPSLTMPAQLSGFPSTLRILNTSFTSAASLLPRHRLPSWHQHVPLLSDLCSSFWTSLPLFPAFAAVPRAQRILSPSQNKCPSLPQISGWNVHRFVKKPEASCEVALFLPVVRLGKLKGFKDAVEQTEIFFSTLKHKFDFVGL